ncbi:hypothetical protein Pst134EA_002462 [Puccinia striiformis f. sp. tritici]|uniref:Amino acid permease/ SLC12A domain-containing protein n=1 Tax=Puccinia striiformis f. sp. tritici PST-78 TaxID=1165861 RepID=A0A0L0V300_9BASI|nr:hypothetical protein Pst134EA_002462 [Puccinia striiformis f. sp. tritici]KAH9464044.1 hypothetical protein Pst134EB_003583 [Puccinia striiformis f. sp. tritici]KAH9471827.1 hypothetical protein Pst134EA_002462 [Puccinia striiformis f. sp. tritici]KNE93685.1 hypothetical protein PSTG_12966 [Puccinia striiformis f. sp. tritici PST-78]
MNSSLEKKNHSDLEKSSASLEAKILDDIVIDTPADNPQEGQMQRRLKARHVSMIAIGGTIGTGLFVGSGEALHSGGPVALLLGYSIMGVIVYSMMVALGEMVTMFPVTGAFIHYTTRFVDPALGFAVGWNYWYSFAVTLPTEITAAGIVIKYWTANVNVAVWITIFLVATTAVNFFGVKWYGEAEFVCSAIKVTAIVGLIILGIVLDLGGGPNHDRIGFRYWLTPGPFNQLNEIPGSTGRFLAFWSVLVQAAFSYQGTEIVALAAGEAENPRKNVPKAINKVFYRILIFYVGGMTVVGLLVPYNSPDLLGGTGDAASSPFVIAIKSAGISVLPDIVNVVILTAVFSAANSDLYAGSRILFGLSSDRMAPRLFSRCTGNGVPVAGIALTALFGLLSYMNVNTSGGTVFQWFSNISSISGLITWWSILLAYIRFYHGLKYNGVDRNTLDYRAPFQPWLSYFGLTMATLIIVFNGFQVFLRGGWSASKFVAAYISLPIFALFFIGWKISHKTAFVRVDQMDFETGRRELDLMDAMEREKEVKPVGKLQKFLHWLM